MATVSLSKITRNGKTALRFVSKVSTLIDAETLKANGFVLCSGLSGTYEIVVTNAADAAKAQAALKSINASPV